MTEKEFERNWVEKLKSSLKPFPDAFVDFKDFRTVEISGKTLTLGAELFGSFEVVDTDGNLIAQVNNYFEAKYFFYSSRNKVSEFKIPTDENEISAAVKSYEKYLDDLIREINSEFKAMFVESKNLPHISGTIFKALNLYRY